MVRTRRQGIVNSEDEEENVVVAKNKRNRPQFEEDEEDEVEMVQNTAKPTKKRRKEKVNGKEKEREKEITFDPDVERRNAALMDNEHSSDIEFPPMDEPQWEDDNPSFSDEGPNDYFPSLGGNEGDVDFVDASAGGSRLGQSGKQPKPLSSRNLVDKAHHQDPRYANSRPSSAGGSSKYQRLSHHDQDDGNDRNRNRNRNFDQQGQDNTYNQDKGDQGNDRNGGQRSQVNDHNRGQRAQVNDHNRGQRAQVNDHNRGQRAQDEGRGQRAQVNDHNRGQRAQDERGQNNNRNRNASEHNRAHDSTGKGKSKARNLDAGTRARGDPSRGKSSEAKSTTRSTSGSKKGAGGTGREKEGGKRPASRSSKHPADPGNGTDEEEAMEDGWDHLDNGMSVSNVSSETKTRGHGTVSASSSAAKTSNKKNGRIHQSSFPSVVQDFAIQAKSQLRYLYVYDDPFPVDDENGITKHEYVMKVLKGMGTEPEGQFSVAWSYLNQIGNEATLMNLITFAWYGRGYLSCHLITIARNLVPAHYGFSTNPDPEAVKDQVSWLLTGYVFIFDKADPVKKEYDNTAPFASQLLVNVIQDTWFPNNRRKLDLKASSRARKEKKLTVPMVLLAATAMAHILCEYSMGTKPLGPTNFAEAGAKTYYLTLKQQWDNVKKNVPNFERYTLKQLFKRAACDFDVFTQVSSQPIAEVDFAAMQAKCSTEMSSDSEDEDGNASDHEERHNRT
ncbi:hypothetical protein CVT24_001162 [Panaeolus cyanescens]|uniref:DUF6532 domain-containing protein n=1 Tax=Panaeolus cyanescens TaxID=181874 RepID=A0A409YYZ6_9AGAR|nr:hypothetical protein CVT24_001162 [Panaeolus cyanescens]